MAGAAPPKHSPGISSGHQMVVAQEARETHDGSIRRRSRNACETDAELQGLKTQRADQIGRLSEVIRSLFQLWARWIVVVVQSGHQSHSNGATNQEEGERVAGDHVGNSAAAKCLLATDHLFVNND